MCVWKGHSFQLMLSGYFLRAGPQQPFVFSAECNSGYVTCSLAFVCFNVLVLGFLRATSLSLFSKVVGLQGIKVRPEAVAFSAKSESKLFLHGRSDARHCLKAVRGRKVERVKTICFDKALGEFRSRRSRQPRRLQSLFG